MSAPLLSTGCGGTAGELPWPHDASPPESGNVSPGPAGDASATADGAASDPEAATPAEGAIEAAAAEAGIGATDATLDGGSSAEDTSRQTADASSGGSDDAWPPPDASVADDGTLDSDATRDGMEADAAAGDCNPQFGRCGGISWTGPTCCVASTCVAMNPYFSQCR